MCSFVADAIFDTFSRLGFKVEVFDDLTSLEMIESFSREFRDDKRAKDDCFVGFLLTHGDYGKVYGVDNIPVEINQLTAMARSTTCRKLANKPKVFFIQACQGKEKVDCKFI